MAGVHIGPETQAGIQTRTNYKTLAGIHGEQHRDEASEGGEGAGAGGEGGGQLEAQRGGGAAGLPLGICTQERRRWHF